MKVILVHVFKKERSKSIRFIISKNMITMASIKFLSLRELTKSSLVIINVIEIKKIKVPKKLTKRINNIPHDTLNLCLKFSLYKLKE